MTPARPAGPGDGPAVLAVDTAGDACGVAVVRGDRVLASRLELRRVGHAEVLLPMVGGVLAEAGLAHDGIDLYAVTLGPGGFTGIRIAIAATAGMALAGDRPILGIDSFTASLAGVAPGVRRGRRWAVVLDSRRGDLFCRLLDAELEPLGPPAVVAPAALGDWLPAEGATALAGNAAARAAAALAGTPAAERLGPVVAEAAVDPGALGRTAAARAGAGDRRVPSPIYLRAPDARPTPTGTGPTGPAGSSGPSGPGAG